MDLLVYGKAGTPVLVFPTEDGDYTEWEEHGMTEALSDQLEQGYNQLFCVNSVDGEGLVNTRHEPRARLLRHRQFEGYVIDELIPYIKKNSSSSYLIAAGARMGGYHAANLAFKYPGRIDKVIAMNGLYDLKPLFHGFFDDDVYYNSPIDYLSLMNDPELIRQLQKLDLRLLAGHDPSAASQAEQLNDTLRRLMPDPGVDHRNEARNEWAFYQEAMRGHII